MAGIVGIPPQQHNGMVMTTIIMATSRKLTARIHMHCCCFH